MSPREAAPAGPLLCLAGATAVGKSAVALVLADQLGGEIISVDSMQVYRGLDIGTAKPTAAERARVPHHLVDVVNVRDAFDVAQWRALAQTAVKEVQGRGRLPILCGGSGLYFRTLLEGLAESPTDPALRAELEATPLAELLRELEVRDPAGFARVDRRNPRRVFRAVEVLRLTGQPLPERPPRTLAQPLEGPGQPMMWVLSRSAEDMRSRIECRVDRMFADGLVEETQRMLGLGLADNRVALQALGYRQVEEHLRGERGLAETVELVKARTRQFARRQRTWFRHQAAARWLELSPSETPEATATLLGAEWRATHQDGSG